MTGNVDLLPYRPSPFQLALALAVVKSKPVDCSVREYLSKLAQYLSNGLRKQHDGIAFRHVDSAAYWKDRHDAVGDQMLGLRSQIASLEHKSLVLQNEKSDLNAQIDTMSKIKRRSKRGNQKANKPSRQVVSLQPDRPGDSINEEVWDRLTSGFGKENIVMQALWQLHKILADPTPPMASLSHHTVEVARSTSEYLRIELVRIYREDRQDTAGQPDQGKDIEILQSDIRFDRLIIAINRVHSILLHSLGRLQTATEPAEEFRGQAVLATVQLLDSLLGFIRTLPLEDNASSAKERPSGQVSNSTSAQSTQKNMSQMRIAGLISCVISNLEIENALHVAVFEGLLYHILSHTAESLHRLTFGGPAATSVEDQIMVDAAQVLSDNDRLQRNESSARNGLYCLVRLLERTLDVAPAFLEHKPLSTPVLHRISSSGSQTAQRNGRVQKRIQKASLSQAAKEKLQATLVDCMFKGGSNGDIDILEKLSEPVDLGTIPAPPKTFKKQDLGEWFTGEVWRLVGWDILGREDGFLQSVVGDTKS